MTTYDTGNPLGSADPRDLYDNAQNTDAAVNGEGKTWVDRFGRTRVSMKGVEEAVPDAIAARDVTISARDDAVLARDASMAAAGPLYATEAAGRAAVADGVSFKVQGSGSIAVSIYRRVNSATSTFLASIPSSLAFDNYDKRVTTFKGILAPSTNITTIGVIGVYALQSGQSYTGIPPEAAGLGCQLMVEPATSDTQGYVIQRLTVHAESERYWTRRVQVLQNVENNVPETWRYSLTPATDAFNNALNASMHQRTSAHPSGSTVAILKAIGSYTLLSSRTYPDIPDYAKGKGCIVEVYPVTPEISLQRLTIHAEGGFSYARRVTYGSDPSNNNPGQWFPVGASFSGLPTGERRIQNGAPWLRRGSVRVRETWGDLYTLPTTTIIGDLTKLYAFYDALVTEFPAYVSREELGRDQWNLPIYQYNFKPPAKRTYEHPASVGRRPKVLITSGTHGGERGALMGVIIFLNNLCRNWKDLEGYDELRWNTDFVVIPATVPSSVEDGARKNRNGVDCNRNFDWKWGQGSNPSPDPESPMYQGPFAASEAEVQVLQAQIPLRHSDAILMVENHNHSNPEAFWVGSNSPNAMYIGLAAADKVTPYLWTEIVPGGDLSKTTQYVTKNYEGSFAGYMEAQGIPTLLIETSGVLDFAQNDGTVTSLRRLHELLLLNIVREAVAKEMRKRFETWPLV